MIGTDATRGEDSGGGGGESLEEGRRDELSIETSAREGRSAEMGVIRSGRVSLTPNIVEAEGKDEGSGKGS